MKRSPMKRGVGLARGTTPMARGKPLARTSALPQRSKRRQRAYSGPDGRAAFVGATLAVRTACEVQWPGCTQQAVDVHESIIRTRGGAIVPGPLADAQGQRFFAICRACHDYTHAHRRLAEPLGFLDPRHASELPQSV